MRPIVDTEGSTEDHGTWSDEPADRQDGGSRGTGSAAARIHNPSQALCAPTLCVPTMATPPLGRITAGGPKRMAQRLRSGRLADTEGGFTLVVGVARVEVPVRRPLLLPGRGGPLGPLRTDAVGGGSDVTALVSHLVLVHGFLLSVWLVAVGPTRSAEWGTFVAATGESGGRGIRTVGSRTGATPDKRKKESLPKKRLLDGSRPCQCLFNPSRVPPELPWRWIRGHPCCTRWRCRQWTRPWTEGPSRPTSGRLPSSAPALTDCPCPSRSQV